MKKPHKTVLCFSTILLSLIWTTYSTIYKQASKNTFYKHANSAPVKSVALESFSTQNQTLSFFENKGQIKTKEHDIRYMVESNGVKLYLKPDGIIYSFSKTGRKSHNFNSANNDEEDAKIEVSYLLMHWKDANTDVQIKAEKQGLEVRNYYDTGSQNGITNVKSYYKIIYENLYDNIDLIFYNKDNELKYDFVVKPGGNVKDIQMLYTGNENETRVCTSDNG